MKKFLLYTIIFLALFVGTATCVVINGYATYTNQQTNTITTTTEIAEESALTSLATNVLNSENYSGTLNLTDNSGNINLDGTFSYVNTESLSAHINLIGLVNKTQISADVILLNNQIFIEFNGQKFTLNTNDIITALNGVLSSINTSADSSLPKLDMAYAQSLLSNITTTEFDTGYLVQGSIPNLCDFFITTNAEYIPTQILVTNICLSDTTCTLNIKASQKYKAIPAVDTREYLNITPAINSLSPIINTLTQGDLLISGTINLNGTKVNVISYLLNNTIIGEANLDNFLIKFQVNSEYVLLDLYGNVFKLTFEDILSLINRYIPNTTSSNISSLDDLLNKIDLSTTTYQNKIIGINAQLDKISLNFIINQTTSRPDEIKSNNYLNKNDIIMLIDGYKNILSNKYSIDVNLEHNDISLCGNAYIELNSNSTALSSLYFDGTLSGLDTTLIYTPEETYIQIANNKIKLKNSSLEKVFEVLLSYTNSSETTLVDTSALYDLSILNNLKVKGRTITLSTSNINATIISYTNSYNLQMDILGANINATIYPNSSAYLRIASYMNKDEFKSYDDVPSLLTALTNTLDKNMHHFTGEIDIKILEFTYKNIKVDINADQAADSLIITLDNLPTDSIVTYLSDTYYKNQKCILTFTGDTLNIYTTVTLNVTNKTVCIAKKTIKISEFSLDNLYDIMSMREPIINQLKESLASSGSNFTSNLTTDCIDILEDKTLIDLNPLVPEIFTNLQVQFFYDKEITRATLHCNLNNLLFVNIMLKTQ